MKNTDEELMNLKSNELEKNERGIAICPKCRKEMGYQSLHTLRPGETVRPGGPRLAGRGPIRGKKWVCKNQDCDYDFGFTDIFRAP